MQDLGCPQPGWLIPAEKMRSRDTAGFCCPCEAVRPHCHHLGLAQSWVQGTGKLGNAPQSFALRSAVYMIFSEQPLIVNE